MIRCMLVVAVLVATNIAGFSQRYLLNSPDNKLNLKIEASKETLKATLFKNEQELVTVSNLSLLLKGNPASNFQIAKTKTNKVAEDIFPEIREKGALYKNVYNELVLVFKNKQSVSFRLFNEGLAYRLSTDLKDSLTILKENAHLQLSEDDSLRFQSERSFNSAYEEPYQFKKINDIKESQFIHLPVLVEKKSGPFLMITESDLYNFPGLWMQKKDNGILNVIHPPYPKELTSNSNRYVNRQVAVPENFIAKVSGKRNYPWRIFAVADTEHGLIDNHMVYLLASPALPIDWSWVKSGVVMFDWWAKNNVYGVDFKAGVNTETAKYFIDFCARNGFRYFLFDDGWSPKDNLLTTVPGLNMEEVTAYAKSKGVDVLLWVIWNTLQDQWEEAFDLFEKWGIKGIKTDFMNRDDQPMVEYYEAMAKKAAEKKMVLNLHGAYKPSGLSRKYPNLLTREGLIEFEQSGVSNNDNPEHHNLLPYIRMFTGAMDYIPATFRNGNKHNFRQFGDYPMGWGTRAHSMALFIILNSPMTMLPGSPSDYDRERECTDFLTKIPLEWDEVKLLDGKIAKFTVLARRNVKDWHLAAITNDDARTVTIKTDFLPAGNYEMEWIEDGKNAATAATDYKLSKKIIKSGDEIIINMAPGGGWLARITPE